MIAPGLEIALVSSRTDPQAACKRVRACADALASYVAALSSKAVADAEVEEAKGKLNAARQAALLAVIARNEVRTAITEITAAFGAFKMPAFADNRIGLFAGELNGLSPNSPPDAATVESLFAQAASLSSELNSSALLKSELQALEDLAQRIKDLREGSRRTAQLPVANLKVIATADNTAAINGLRTALNGAVNKASLAAVNVAAKAAAAEALGATFDTNGKLEKPTAPAKPQAAPTVGDPPYIQIISARFGSLPGGHRCDATPHIVKTCEYATVKTCPHNGGAPKTDTGKCDSGNEPINEPARLRRSLCEIAAATPTTPYCGAGSGPGQVGKQKVSIDWSCKSGNTIKSTHSGCWDAGEKIILGCRQGVWGKTKC